MLPNFLRISDPEEDLISFNGHPPLGVNATSLKIATGGRMSWRMFQWAPTLGGECYRTRRRDQRLLTMPVSMGTHPWG